MREERFYLEKSLRFRSTLRDPAGENPRQRPDGYRRSKKRKPQSPNWADDQLQKHASDLPPLGGPTPGPNIGNREERNQRRNVGQFPDPD